jgi:hypothetical protein
MSENKIPAEHLSRLAAATDAQLRTVISQNRAARGRLASIGSEKAGLCLAYIDAAQAILNSRHPAAPQLATDQQVDYAWKLYVSAFRSGAVLSDRTAGLPDYTKTALAAMTRSTISDLIDTLKEQY